MKLISTTCGVAVSDRYSQNGIGTFGIVIADPQNKQKIKKKISNRVCGNPGTLSSYRAEARGFLPLQWESIYPSSFYCDNKAVVDSIPNHIPLHPLVPEWDLLEPIWQYCHEFKIQCKNVKTHQDANKNKHEMSPIEILNCKDCKLAKTALAPRLPLFSLMTFQ